jgi:membrane protease YdiL (CAAX protease family)
MTTRATRSTSARTIPTAGATRSPGPWLLGVAELALAVTVVLLDVAVPSLVLLLLAAVSLAVRREVPSSLGLRRSCRPHLVLGTAVFAVVWSLFQLTVTMPVANHLSGEQQDVGVFADVENNLGLLLLLLLLSWTLGACVEEVAFRGFLLTRLRELLGNGAAATVGAVLVSSALFGVLHSEQGLVGLVTFFLVGPVHGFS